MAHSETRLANFVHCKTDFGTDPINSDKSRAGAKIAEAEGRSYRGHSGGVQGTAGMIFLTPKRYTNPNLP
jgi:hypothetical protein